MILIASKSRSLQNVSIFVRILFYEIEINDNHLLILALFIFPFPTPLIQLPSFPQQAMSVDLQPYQT